MRRGLCHSIIWEILFVLSLLSGWPMTVEALPEHVVFGMRTEITMSEKDIPRKDYYLNIGTAQGIKKGSVLEVFRSVTTSDDINNRSAQNIVFRVAKIKVIHAENAISVGRIVEILPPSEIPIGAYPTIVVGDRVAVEEK